MASGKGSGRVRVLVSQERIERRVAEIAAQLDADYGPLVSEAEPLIAIGVLKGSVFFLVDLLKRVKVPVAFDFFQTCRRGGLLFLRLFEIIENLQSASLCIDHCSLNNICQFSDVSRPGVRL